jgi:catechol 2,3-dioxygenase-like lactoylglutathione lyase family enzyme
MYHIGINCADLQRAAAFYDTVLGTLGHRRLMDFGAAIG